MTTSIYDTYSGKLIAFMGLDGAGKTTHAKLLKEALDNTSLNLVVHVIHGYSPRKHVKNLDNYVSSHNEDPLQKILPNNRSVALLIDLWANMVQKIIPWLRNGDIVILDSYYYNSIAFAPLLGANPTLIKDLIKIFPIPDATIYLRLTPDESWQRVNQRRNTTGKQINEKEQPEYLTKAFKEYEQITHKSQNNVITINAFSEMDIVSKQISTSLISLITKYTK